MDDFAPDGSPVAFYRRLPATGEPELIHAAIAPGASVLDPGCGQAFVATAAAHLEPDGVVVAETYPPGWDPAASAGVETRLGDALITLLSATIDRGLLRAEGRYGIDGHEWQQSFTARLLNEATRREMFDREGLEVLGWLDRPGWFLAKLAD